MSTKFASRLLLFASLCSVFAASQEKSVAAPTPSALEFPVVFEQSVTAGKTPEGTKVQGKLQVATLLGHTVVPRDSVFDGEVVASGVRSKTTPSILAIRIRSVEWKSGTEKLTLYLVPWYYPPRMQEGQDLQYGPQQPANRTWNGQGQYPDNSGLYKPFPGSDANKGSADPEKTPLGASPHMARMDGIESHRDDDGTITLISKKSNIKLDKATTYVLSETDAVAPSTK